VKTKFHEAIIPRLFFTSDQHFSHRRIIEYEKRPFAGVDVMNEELIHRWNTVVPENGIVICAGDFSFSKASKFTDHLNGTIHLVQGTHDHYAAHDRERAFASVSDILYLAVGEQFIVVSHCPFESWERMHYGSWHIHGHTHGHARKVHNRMDVGIDVPGCTYAPWTYNEVKNMMEALDVPE